MKIPTYRFEYETGGMAPRGATSYGLEAAYWNNGHPVAIVARVNPHNWAAYVGAGASPFETEEQTLALVARQGVKLTEEEARFFFPNLAELEYRA